MADPLDQDISEEDVLGVYASQALGTVQPVNINTVRLTPSQLEQVTGELMGLDIQGSVSEDGTIQGREAIETLARLHGKGNREVEMAVKKVLARGVRSQVEVAKDKAVDLRAALERCEEGLAPGYTNDSSYSFTEPLSTHPGAITQILYRTQTDERKKLTVDALWQTQESGSSVLEKKILTIQHPYAGGAISAKVDRAVGLKDTVASAWAGLTNILGSSTPTGAKVRQLEKTRDRVRGAAARYAQAELADQGRVGDEKGFEVVVYGLLSGEPAERVLTLEELFLWGAKCNETYESKSLGVDPTIRSTCFVRYKAVRNLSGKVAEQLQDALRTISSFGEPES